MKKLILAIIFVFYFGGYAFAKINVVTTTFMLSSIVKQIGKNYVDTAYLIPVGSNPHIFSPKPKSLMKLTKAQLFIGVGYGFEFWLSSINDFLKNKKVMFLSEYYKNPIDKVVIKGKTIANPHIWLDLDFMSNVAVYKIADKLCSLEPKHCKTFEKNAKMLSEKIKSIKNMYIKTLEPFKQYCFLDIKPAFEYLLKSVGVHSCCVLIKKGNQEPTIGDIKNAIENCRCKKGIVLYISDYQIASMMSERLHFKMVALNPLGDKKTLNTYPKLLKYNLNQLKKALK